MLKHIILLMMLLGATPVAAASLLCEKSAESRYCHNGQRREVCTQGGYIVWADTRVPIIVAESNMLAVDGPLPSPSCQCWDINQRCLASSRTDCQTAFLRCNTGH